MNGPSLQKGCPGAAYQDGHPSRGYCQNDEGKYLWWQMCCYWNGKICLPKEHVSKGKAGSILLLFQPNLAFIKKTKKK